MITKTGLIYSDNEDLSQGTYSGTIEEDGEVNSINLPDFPVGTRIYCKAYCIDGVERIESEIESYVNRYIDYFYIQNEYQGQNTITLTTRRGDMYNVPHIALGVSYSKDKTNWTSVSLMPERNSTITTNITLEEGERVYFRNSNGYFNYIEPGLSVYWYTTITGSQLHSAGGNVKTLLSYDSDVNVPNYAFKRLFYNNTNLTKSPELPTTEFGGECFYEMFYGCTSMTTPPTTISTPQMGANSCAYMFRNCSSLTTVPTLPSTNLNNYCYLSMFNRCTSLSTVPSDLLPATTLYQGCYYGMFYNCSGLTSTPELPATTLLQSSYQSMFKGCSLVNSIKIYADDISTTDCLTDWLNGVAASGTFHNLGRATYPSGVNGIPSGWTVVTT